MLMIRLYSMTFSFNCCSICLQHLNKKYYWWSKYRSSLGHLNEAESLLMSVSLLSVKIMTMEQPLSTFNFPLSTFHFQLSTERNLYGAVQLSSAGWRLSDCWIWFRCCSWSAQGQNIMQLRFILLHEYWCRVNSVFISSDWKHPTGTKICL